MRSIRARFLLVSLATVTVALSLAAWVFILIFTANIEKRIDAELSGHLLRIAGMLSFEPDGKLERPENPADNRFYQPYGGLYWQIDDPARNVVLRSASLFDYALPLPDDEQKPGVVHRYRLPGPDGADVEVQERKLIVPAPGGPRTLRIAVAIASLALDQARSGFAMAILPYLAVLGIILVAASALQLSYGLRPLSDLTREMLAIRERRRELLSGTYPKELQALASQMNELLQAQSKSMETARGRAADLAHGLKTPLTVIANDALTLRERGDVDMADELDGLVTNMLAHVDHELARSRIAQTPQQRRSDADLRKTIDDIVRTLKRTPDGEQLDWVVTVPGPLNVPLDPHDLRELVGNLLENACKWARAAVRISTAKLGPDVLLLIEDDGPGVAPDKIASMTSRGVRLDMSKPGTGLGLAIVKDIADVYQLSLSFENAAKGGLRVTIRFQAA